MQVLSEGCLLVSQFVAKACRNLCCCASVALSVSTSRQRRVRELTVACANYSNQHGPRSDSPMTLLLQNASAL